MKKNQYFIKLYRNGETINDKNIKIKIPFEQIGTPLNEILEMFGAALVIE